MSPQKDIADPFAAWRSWVAESERQWNSFLNEAMATEEFSQNMGQFMEVYLTYQKSMNEAMGRYFSSLNVASRTDVLTLGDRLGAVEAKLDKIIKRLDEQARPSPDSPSASTTSTANSATPRPRRTKQPPSADHS